MLADYDLDQQQLNELVYKVDEQLQTPKSHSIRIPSLSCQSPLENKTPVILDYIVLYKNVLKFAEGLKDLIKGHRKEIPTFLLTRKNILDKSYQVSKVRKYSQIYSRYRQLKKFAKRVPIMQPFHYLTLLFDLYNMMTSILALFVFSFISFFEHEIIFRAELVWLIFLSFSFHILAKFNTAFLKQGTVVMDRRQIVLNYWRQDLKWDLAVLLSVFSNIFDQFGYFRDLVTYLVFLRILTVKDLIRKFDTYFNFQGIKRHIADILYLVLTLYLVIHFLGVIWHGLGLIEVKGLFGNSYREKNWFFFTGIEDDDSLTSHYTISIYFIAVTLNTVGYGDITAQNSIERSFVIVTMMLGGVLYAYSINEIGSIMTNIRQGTKIYEQDLQAINVYMQQENVNRDLRTRIQNYLNFQHKQDNEYSRAQREQVITKLSKQLQIELKSDIQSKYMTGISILSEKFSKKTVQRLIPLMEECRFSAGEFVYKEAESEDFCLYFIVSGEVEELFQKSKKSDKIQIRRLSSNQYFGEFCFFTGLPRESSIKVMSFSKMFRIRRESLLQVLKQDDQDYQNFCALRDSIIFEGVEKDRSSREERLQDFDKVLSRTSSQPNDQRRQTGEDRRIVQCSICGALDHLSNDCRFCHYVPQRLCVISRNEYSVDQDRQSSKRLHRAQHHPFQDIIKIQQAVIDILDSDELIPEIDQICQNIEEFSDDDLNIDQLDEISEPTQEENDSEFIRSASAEQIRPHEKFKKVSNDLLDKRISEELEEDDQYSKTILQESSRPQIESSRLTHQVPPEFNSNNKIDSEHPTHDEQSARVMVDRQASKKVSSLTQQSGKSVKSMKSMKSQNSGAFGRAGSVNSNQEGHKKHLSGDKSPVKHGAARPSGRKMSIQGSLKDNLLMFQRNESMRKATKMIFAKQNSKLQKMNSAYSLKSLNSKKSLTSIQSGREDESQQPLGQERFVLEFNNRTRQFEVIPTRTIGGNLNYNEQKSRYQNSQIQMSSVFDHLESTFNGGRMGFTPSTSNIFNQTGDTMLVKALSFYLQSNQDEDEEKIIEYFIGNIAFDKMHQYKYYKKYNNSSVVIQKYNEKQTELIHHQARLQSLNRDKRSRNSLSKTIKSQKTGKKPRANSAVRQQSSFQQFLEEDLIVGVDQLAAQNMKRSQSNKYSKKRNSRFKNSDDELEGSAKLKQSAQKNREAKRNTEMIQKGNNNTNQSQEFQNSKRQEDSSSVQGVNTSEKRRMLQFQFSDVR